MSNPKQDIHVVPNDPPSPVMDYASHKMIEDDETAPTDLTDTNHSYFMELLGPKNQEAMLTPQNSSRINSQTVSDNFYFEAEQSVILPNRIQHMLTPERDESSPEKEMNTPDSSSQDESQNENSTDLTSMEQYAHLTQRLIESEREVEAKRKAVDQLRATLKELLEKAKEHQVEKRNLSVERDELQIVLDMQTKLSSTRLTNLREISHTTTESILHNEELTAHIARLENLLNDERIQVRRKESELQQCWKREAEHLAEKEKEKQHREVTAARNLQLMESLKQMEQERDEARNEMVSFRSGKLEVEIELQKKEKHNNELCVSLLKEQDRVQTLRRKLNDYDVKETKRQQELNKASLNSESAQFNHLQTNKELEKARYELAKLRNENESLSIRLASALSTHSKQRGTVTDAQSENATIRGLKDEIVIVREQLESNEQDLADKNFELAQAEKEKQILRDTIRELTLERDQSINERTKLQQRVHELEYRRENEKTTDDSNSEDTDCFSDFEMSMRKKKTVHKQHQRVVTTKTNEDGPVGMILPMSETQMMFEEDLRATLIRTTNKLKFTQGELRGLDEDAKKLIRKRKTEVDNLTKELKKQKNAHNISRQQITSVSCGLKDVKQELESLRQEIVTSPLNSTTYSQSSNPVVAQTVQKMNSILASSALNAKLCEEMKIRLGIITSAWGREFEKRRTLHNSLMELRGRIRVYVRIRPLDLRAVAEAKKAENEFGRMRNQMNDEEQFGAADLIEGKGSEAVTSLDSHTHSIIRMKSDDSIILIPKDKLFTLTQSISGKGGPTSADVDAAFKRGQSFQFDRVFGEKASQETVFAEIEPLATTLLDGCDVCVMAYGQTGTGKTFTMNGTPTDEGLIKRLLRRVWEENEERGAKIQSEGENGRVSMWMSMCEIYNKKSNCLITEKNKRAKSSESLDQPTNTGDTQLPNDFKSYARDFSLLTEQITSIDDALRIMDECSELRQTAKTRMNKTSSRSHLFTILYIAQQNVRRWKGTDRETRQTVLSKLILVDLAGSENAEKAQTEGTQRFEGGEINKSLTALGRVLETMRDNQSRSDQKKGQPAQQNRIPFADSQLTRMLEDPLNRSGHVALIVCVSGNKDNLTETTYALDFGLKARQTKAAGRK
ncbi:putative Kinesin heavy chain [Blattamonas nauphoetae]|uniref:Kinesin heavy chain n=1 Tax=Blattamonas nauphoetae TaxID=2049346 RepID=A0ABQ9WTG4_9EUKA|nr:putative Kinesin heavy chain [Blattamonas nauphoetae]